MKTAITKIDEHLRIRIRVIIWKQWKIPKRRTKALIQIRVKPELAKTISYTRKSYQLICKTDWLKFAINIERLIKNYNYSKVINKHFINKLI